MLKKDQATTANPDYSELYAVVGELVMIANAVDHLLNQLVIEALHLEKSPMLESVLATLDPRQKIEMLKGRAKLINTLAGKRASRDFATRRKSSTGSGILCATRQRIQTATHGSLSPSQPRSFSTGSIS